MSFDSSSYSSFPQTFIVWKHKCFLLLLLLNSSLSLSFGARVSLEGNSFQTLGFLPRRLERYSRIDFFINRNMRRQKKIVSALFWMLFVYQWWTRESWDKESSAFFWLTHSFFSFWKFLFGLFLQRLSRNSAFVFPFHRCENKQKFCMLVVCINCVTHRGSRTLVRVHSKEMKALDDIRRKGGEVERNPFSSTMKQKNLFFCFIFNMLCLFYGH